MSWMPTLIYTPFTLVFGILLVLGTAVFSWLAVKRSGFTRGMILLETLRMLLVSMVAFTLNQPELTKEFQPEQNPVLLVLWDESGSMQTQDITADNSADAQTRAKWIEPLLEEAIWEPFEEKVEVVVEPFSSDLKDRKKASDLNSALAKAMEKHRNLRGIVMFSDGSDNYGDSPTLAAAQLRMKGIPVFSVAVGSESPLPDIEILALDAPPTATVGKPTRIPYSIKSTMARDTNMVVSLSSSDGDEITANIQIPANGTFSDAFTLKPKKVGDYKLTLNVPRQAGEFITDNNKLDMAIQIEKKPLKVLVVESFPRWEYRYLRNALSRDPGVEVSCLLYHPQLPKVGGGKDYIEEFPQTRAELAEFDVVFIGDVGVGEDQLTEEDCKNLKGLVQSQASGLIFMPGFRGRQFSLQDTELGDLYPVVLDRSQLKGWGSPVPAQFRMTERGKESLLTKLADSPEANASVWRTLPGFQWYAPILRSKAGTQTLAVHASESNTHGRIPLIVTKTYGTGKILFMGTDGAWRWREGVEDKYHYRFWGQVARWMAYQRNMAGNDSMRFYYSPDAPKVGNSIDLSANVMTVTGEPLQQGTVNVQLTAPSGNTETIRLAAQNSEDQWGLFTGDFSPQEKGTYQVVMTCRENGSTLEETIRVQGSEREKQGKPADFELLDQISKITRGRMVKTDGFQEIFDELSELDEPAPKQKRIRLWANPFWAGAIVLLLGVFWAGRKMVGKV